MCAVELFRVLDNSSVSGVNNSKQLGAGGFLFCGGGATGISLTGGFSSSSGGMGESCEEDSP
jgi:hypothetical protein